MEIMPVIVSYLIVVCVCKVVISLKAAWIHKNNEQGKKLRLPERRGFLSRPKSEVANHCLPH